MLLHTQSDRVCCYERLRKPSAAKIAVLVNETFRVRADANHVIERRLGKFKNEKKNKIENRRQTKYKKLKLNSECSCSCTQPVIMNERINSKTKKNNIKMQSHGDSESERD